MNDAPDLSRPSSLWSLPDPLDRGVRLRLKREWKTNPPGDDAPLIGLVGSFTLEPWVPFLGTALAAARLPYRIHVAPFNQIHQTCIAVERTLGERPELLVVVWRIEELFEGELWSALTTGGFDADAVDAKLDELAAVLSAATKQVDGAVIAGLPPFPATWPEVDLPHPLHAAPAAELFAYLSGRWRERLNDLKNVLALDLDLLERQLGIEASLDRRKDLLYHQPYTEAFAANTAFALARLIRTRRIPRKKVVVLDCDNTLWGGVVGEDGVGGLVLGDDFPGSAFRAFQRALVHLHHQGVLLALASKNNEEEVWQVFDQHEAMVLRREHLSASRINWNPKDQGLREIAAELELGIDSLVFIDDSSIEIARVSAGCPEVLCLQVPEDPADLPGLLQQTLAFDQLALTDEDRARGARYAEERVRTSAKAELSEEAFLASLELSVNVFEIEQAHLARVTQLINKTNQFNLTTVRRTEDEVRELMAGDRHTVLAVEVVDRFGDYGLTGVVVAERTPAEWTLDTFLLSCRVLGRGVETSVLREVAVRAEAGGAATIVGRFVPTAKNKPASTVLADHGMQPAGEERWTIGVDALKSADPKSS